VLVRLGLLFQRFYLALDIVPSSVDVTNVLIGGVRIVLAHGVEQRRLDHIQVLEVGDGRAGDRADEDGQEQSEVQVDDESIFLRNGN
jgi:hypothetical protein